MTARHDDELRAALGDAWEVFPDGAPVAWLQRQLGAFGAKRVAGADLMAAVMKLGAPLGVRHYLFGSTPETVRALADVAASEFDADIVDFDAPPVAPLDELGKPEVLERIRAADADIVWCALGAPKQELWMGRHAAALAPAVVIGVGAAFDFLAGMKPRAPEWMQRGGLEWAHRFASEPRRLSRRYLSTNSEFAARAAADVVRRGIATPRLNESRSPDSNASP